MIDSKKLLPRRTLDKSVLSEKTIANIVIIKKDVKKIDNLLETKLILSKERQRIANRRAEQLRRRQREENLEKTDDENLDIDIRRDPKTPRKGGLLTALFAGLIGGIGFLVIKSIPLFKKIGSILTTIASPFIRLFTSIGKLVTSVVKKLKPETEKLSDASQKGGDDVKKLPNLLERVGNDLQMLAGVLVANAAISSIITGVGSRKVSKIVNAARSKRLMTPVQVNAVQKAMKESAVAETVEEVGSFRKARNIKKVMVTESIVKEVASSVKKEANSKIEEVIESTVNSSGVRRRFGKDFKKGEKTYLDMMIEQGSFTDTVRRKKKFSQTATMGAGINPEALRKMGLDPSITEFGKVTTGALRQRSTPIGRSVIGSEDLENFFKKLINDENTGFKAAKNASIEEIKEADKFTKEITKRYNKFITSTDVNKQRRLKELLDGLISGGVDPADIQRFRSSLTFSAFKPIDSSVLKKPIATETTADVLSTKDILKNQRFKAPKIRANALVDATKTVAGRQTLKSLGFISKNVIRQSLGAVPLLGDLAVLLLDIYVFGEIPARAGFKTIGSIVGSIVGGIVGSLIAPPVGTIVGAIIGGIGGDILGAVTFDFLESRTDYGIYGPPDQKRFSQKDVTKAVIGGTTKGLTVKDLGGKFEVGQKIVNKGDGTEFIIDSNSYSALNKFAPGAIEALNAGDGGFDTIKSLMSKLPYERGTKTKVFPVPIPSGGGKKAVSNEGESNFVNFESEGGLGSFLAMVTQNKYKR